MKKKLHVIGGGTVSHVRSHLALSAPAYGKTARDLAAIAESHPSEKYDVHLHLTRMADSGNGNLETNEDIANLVDSLVADDSTGMIILNASIVDFYGSIDDQMGKYAPRLQSRDAPPTIDLTKADKIIGSVRKDRKDIFLVGFKETAGATEDEQYVAGLNLVKEASANLVLANDRVSKTNMIIAPEEARYGVTTDRTAALTELIDIAYQRSDLTFTRSTVVDGDLVPWHSEEIPDTLRDVVDYCIERGAYKPFRGATAGHFAAKIGDGEFLTSVRKTNYNDLTNEGLVRIKTDGPDSVIAYGAKPSVGGQSQRSIFDMYEDCDSIVHFHCPIKEGSSVPQVEQRPYECGSHQCGQNTANGLEYMKDGIYAVHLMEHGPNIVFNSKTTDPAKVKEFIRENFALDMKTGGIVQ